MYEPARASGGGGRQLATVQLLLTLLVLAVVGALLGIGIATLVHVSGGGGGGGNACTTALPSGAQPYMFVQPRTCVLTMRVALYDATTSPLVNTSQLREAARGVQEQCERDVEPAWGVSCEITLFSPASPPDDWTRYVPVLMTDNNAVQLGNACSYHCTQTDGPRLCNARLMTGLTEPSLVLGQPWISLPLGTENDNDGALRCFPFSEEQYGVTFAQQVGALLAHELIEAMVNPNLGRFATQLGAAAGVLSNFSQVDFYWQEVCDPLAYGPGYYHPDSAVWLPNFALPQYFVGCTTADCDQAPGPYDHLHFAPASLTPYQGVHPLLRYNTTDGSLAYCIAYSPPETPTPVQLICLPYIDVASVFVDGHIPVSLPHVHYAQIESA